MFITANQLSYIYKSIESNILKLNDDDLYFDIKHF